MIRDPQPARTAVDPRPHRTVPRFGRGLCYFCVGALLICGCSARAGAARPATLRNEPAAQDIDPDRAYVPLDELAPRIETPQAPESLSPLSPRAAGQVSRAFERAEQQRFTEALNELERALRYDPDHPEIHRALAEVNQLAGNLQRAKTHATRAIEGNPDDAQSHYLLGTAHAAEENHDAAIRSLRTALACSGAEADAALRARCLAALAAQLAEAGYLQAALDAYAGWIENPDAEGLGGARLSATFRTDILERLGRWSEAADALGSVEPSPRLAMRRANLLFRADRVDEALARVRAAMGARSAGGDATTRTDAASVTDALDLLQQIHTRRGTPDEALADVRAWLAADPPADTLVALCGWLTDRGHGDVAEAALAEHLDAHPDRDEVRAALIDALIQRSAWDRALGAVADAIRRDSAAAERFSPILSRIADGTGGDARATLDAGATSDPGAAAALIEPADDDDHATAYSKGVIARRLGRLPEAERLLERSRSLDAGFVPARALLGDLYLERFRYDEAIEAARREDPDVPAHAALERILGRAHEKLDDADAAELHLKAAIQLDPTDVESMYLLAEVYHRTQRINLAHQRLQTLVDIDPAHERARELLSRLFILTRRREEAIRQYDELIKATDSPAVRARASAWLSLVTDADARKFRSMLERAIEDGHDDERTWLALGDSFRVAGGFDMKPARAAYGAALKRNPDSEAAHLGLIDAEWSALNFEEVIRLWQSLMPQRPNRHAWRLGDAERSGLVDAMLALRRVDPALELLRSYAARSDLSAADRDGYREAIRDALWSFDRKDEAVEAVREWAAAEDPPGDWSKRLVLVYLANDQAADALPLLERMVADAPADAWLAARLRDALVASEQFARADQLALDRLFNDPDSDEAMAFLLQTLDSAGRHDDAIELVRNKIERSVRRTLYQELLIDLLNSAERYQDANDQTLSVIEELLTRFRGDMREVDHFRARLAHQLIFNTREYAEAERLLARWVEEATSPASRFDYLIRLAACLDFQERADDAQEVKMHAIAIRPFSVGLNNDVAYGWIDKGVRLKQADPMIRFAVAQSPRESAYLDTYGWLLYKDGRFEEARTWLSRAHAARDSADPVILDHWGDACHRAGAVEEAVAHWRAALEALDALEDGPRNADDQRVRSDAAAKIAAVEAGSPPQTAALEVEPPTGGEAPSGDAPGAGE